MEAKRVAMMDNLRGLLMILVVFGHVLERIYFPGNKWLYQAIYAFHMPAMVFLSGLYYKRNNTKLWRTTFLPYLIFQVIYLAEAAWEGGKPLVLQFSTPSWILWYMLALVLWNLLTNLIDLKKQGKTALLLSLLCALLAGFETKIGYYFTLSRVIVFFPFFLAGACIRENTYPKFLDFFHQKRPVYEWFLLLIPGIVSQIFLYSQRELYQKYFFYGSYAYNDAYTLKIRLLLLLCAAAAILALCTLIPKKEVPFLTYLGRNTAPVYLLHGVLLKAAFHLEWTDKLPGHYNLHAPLLTLLLVLLTVSPPVVFLYNKAFSRKKE